MTAYYNENDRFAAAWLRNLIAANLIAKGEVDERSIEDVHPNDLRGFTQCHFFAGIGVWSYAPSFGVGQADTIPASASPNGVTQGDTNKSGSQGRELQSGAESCECTSRTPSFTNGFWRDAEWLYCRDGKFRPTKPSLFPLAHGVTNRVGMLRGAGNAIVVPQAQAFIEAYMETESL